MPYLLYEVVEYWFNANGTPGSNHRIIIKNAYDGVIALVNNSESSYSTTHKTSSITSMIFNQDAQTNKSDAIVPYVWMNGWNGPYYYYDAQNIGTVRHLISVRYEGVSSVTTYVKTTVYIIPLK